MIYDLFQVITSIFVSGLMFSMAVLLWIFVCIGRMKMFQKAGTAGWKAWIPFYRDYVLCEITMGRGWYFLFGLIPFLIPLMKVIYAIEITLSYGQNFLFGILYFFFPWICELIAGFGQAPYLGAQDLEGQIRSLFSGDPKQAFRKGASGTSYTRYTDTTGTWNKTGFDSQNNNQGMYQNQTESDKNGTQGKPEGADAQHTHSGQTEDAHKDGTV